MADPDWCKGRYFDEGKEPRNGLAVARMAAHITYLSEEALQRKFGRNLQDVAAKTFSFNADFQVESYLRHQGSTFVDRFDANSYLYITRAIDYFDLAAEYGNVLANAFNGTRTRFCVVSFTSDWLYPTRESREIVQALTRWRPTSASSRSSPTRATTPSCWKSRSCFAAIRGFLSSAADRRGLKPAQGQTLMLAPGGPREHPRRPSADRRDGLPPVRACSMSAAAMARCCSC